MFEIPEGSRTAAGRAVVNLLRLAQDENITAFVPVRDFTEDRFVFMATANGIVKKTNLAQFQNPLASGIIAVNLDEGDRLIGVQLTDGEADVILVTQNCIAIRFSEEQVRAVGRTARGVRGINLRGDDAVVSMTVTAPFVDAGAEQEQDSQDLQDFEQDSQDSRDEGEDTLLIVAKKRLRQTDVSLRIPAAKTRRQRRDCY